MTKMRRVVQGSEEYRECLRVLSRRGETDLGRVEDTVRAILTNVRERGDEAVRKYITEFERREVDGLVLTDYGGREALESLDAGLRDAMTEAAARIRRYHERQLEQLTSFEYVEDGVTLGSRITPLARVGIYVPGGKASYPSSVLMSAVPASVAGVSEIIVATPSPTREVRAACALAGVHAILDAGGAQAIAALAYGTESVPRVDKIVGPGNLYVAAAKRLVFGEVDIDSIAGPSEILVLADENAAPAVVAADLLSQAEHDEDAYALLACTSTALADAVDAELERQLATLSRRSIAAAAIENHGVCFTVSDARDLSDVANALAAEHVAVHTREPRAVADRVLRAGAIFIGADTPEAAGDYFAGPSHVLPTGGAARYGAPLGAYDFVSRTSLIGYLPGALSNQAAKITTFARTEGLEAHARAVEIRVSAQR